MWKDFLIVKCVVNVLDLFSLLSEPFGEHPCQFIGLEAFPLDFLMVSDMGQGRICSKYVLYCVYFWEKCIYVACYYEQ